MMLFSMSNIKVVLFHVERELSIQDNLTPDYSRVAYELKSACPGHTYDFNKIINSHDIFL